MPALGLGVLGEGEQFPAEAGLGVALPGRFGQRLVGEFVFARLLDEFFGALQRGQMARDAVQHGGPFVLGAFFFLALDFFPLRPDGVDIVRVGVSENMRVTADQLVGDGAGGFLKIEDLPFLRELAVKDDLQQQVAAFLEHLLVVTGLDRVDQFVHLFDGMEADRLVVLFSIPGAAAGAAEPGHHFD